MVHVQMHGITMMHVQNMVLPCYMSKTKTRLYHDACTKHGMTMVHLQKIGYYHGTSKKKKKLSIIMVHNITIPLLKTLLSTWGKTLVGYHRDQTFLVVGHQVCTHLRRDFAPPSLQILSESLRFRG